MAQISFAVAAKAPASTKIQIISRTLRSPAPDEKTEIFRSMEIPRVVSIPQADARMNAAATGTL